MILEDTIWVSADLIKGCMDFKKSIFLRRRLFVYHFNECWFYALIYFKVIEECFGNGLYSVFSIFF